MHVSENCIPIDPAVFQAADDGAELVLKTSVLILIRVSEVHFCAGRFGGE